ncbi:hypothetical protein NA56DRAFT_704044 [Hyaloscypha hepaticicola]|uniref:Uncharacterized protein n=1 Tax=Hyaloscypha hepaticicola TaxID=2082293 RepID=A0A2J6Q3K1_9HELO|nr:hypothetical protein NA56DRAFT_704044 [Hyaloscypha hepaticicola]
MRRKTFGFDDHQILEHRHRHSYWKIELLTPESDIAWANALVSSIQARAGSQSHVGAGGGALAAATVRMRAQDVWLRGPFLKKLPVSLLCSFLDYAPCSDHVPACRSFDLPVSPFVKDQWLALSCDKPPRRSLTTSSVKVCFLDLPSDEDASGVSIMCLYYSGFSESNIDACCQCREAEYALNMRHDSAAPLPDILIQEAPVSPTTNR